MSRTISIFNMKGGVGKSTTAYNLAAGLKHFHDKKVLLIDIDPQGNSAVALGIKVWELKIQVMNVLQRKALLKDVIISTPSGVDVAPSNILLGDEEIPIASSPGRELLLRKALTPLRSSYDFILIDCPPNIGVFSINALMASDEVILPVDMSYLGLLGLASIERAINLIRKDLEHPIKMTGVLATRYDSRNNLSKQVKASLKDKFGNKLFKTLIPESVKLREAPSHSQTIYEYDPNGKGALAYSQLVKEVIA